MPFDYFIIATGVTRNARRTVCLQNIGNAANCRDWLASASPGGTSWDTSPASHGWQVWIERAAYTRWALMLLETSDTWMTGTTTFNGPVHSNSRFWMWGNPTFAGQVTQFENDVFFGNSGSPVLLTASSNPLPDPPVYQVMDLQRNTARVDPPADNNPAWAVLGQDPALSGMPTDADVRARTTQLADTADPVPDGIYFMDECGSATCGGIHVQGNVLNMVLAVEATKQVIYIVTPTESRKFILDSATNTRVCTPPPTYATCIDLGKGFNGILFVQGSITSTWPNTQTGLYGTVQNNTRLTIAADGEIRVTDHIVYQDPPSGPGDTVQNMLGLYAWCSTPDAVNPNACAGGAPRNVTVDGWLAPGPPLDAPVQDLYIDATVLAPWGEFWVEGWDATSDKGTLRFLGGTVQNSFGAWGGFDEFGNLTGYGRNMTYDQRLGSNVAPPFFPLTDFYAAPRWPRFDDLLYDRPLWQELTQP
jgi:hypothetical protein